MAAPPDEDNRWSFQEEMTKLFDVALKRSFPDLEPEPMLFSCAKKEHGDYQCENVVTIWAELRKRGTNPKGPILVGEAIKENLPVSDMIETSSIHDIGFVTFNLSGKWIAESIHKMLTGGIDTWAPKLPVKRVIVDSPSRDIADEMHVDRLRSTCIRNTLVRMLEYCKVVVPFSRKFEDFLLQGHIVRTLELLKKNFLIEESEGDTVIFVEAEGKKKPLVVEKRDGGFGNAFKDLGALWYGLNEQKADWIVYMTPVQQQEYIEMCFSAAKLVGWIPTDRDKFPRTSYVGYRTCSTDLVKLVYLLDKAKNRCVTALVEQGKPAELLEYTAEAILECAFKYSYLKNHRLANYTFNIDEMLNDEGNTVVYLLNTHARICSITMKSCKDIDELKKASMLTLDQDKEHELGLHLLRFTEVLEESCMSVLPHILCEYLYELAKKFTSYHSSVGEVGSVAETSRLLLCEATAVVMEKCFHLLGITPVNSLV